MPFRKWEIDETVNFQNFHKITFLHFYGILAFHFQMGKTKEVNDKAHEACCNGHHLYIGEVN